MICKIHYNGYVSFVKDRIRAEPGMQKRTQGSALSESFFSFILHRRILVTSVMRGMRKTNLSSSWVTILR